MPAASAAGGKAARKTPGVGMLEPTEAGRSSQPSSGISPVCLISCGGRGGVRPRWVSQPSPSLSPRTPLPLPPHGRRNLAKEPRPDTILQKQASFNMYDGNGANTTRPLGPFSEFPSRSQLPPPILLPGAGQRWDVGCVAGRHGWGVSKSLC